VQAAHRPAQLVWSWQFICIFQSTIVHEVSMNVLRSFIANYTDPASSNTSQPWSLSTQCQSRQ